MLGAVCQLRVDGQLSTAGPDAIYAPHDEPDPPSKMSPQRLNDGSAGGPTRHKVCGCLALWNRVRVCMLTDTYMLPVLR